MVMLRVPGELEPRVEIVGGGFERSKRGSTDSFWYRIRYAHNYRALSLLCLSLIELWGITAPVAKSLDASRKFV
jgi:hypothetical protein